MNIGFTGTQKGISRFQAQVLMTELALHWPEIKEVHHGCCIGADYQFHQLCQWMKLPIYLHPPIDTRKMAPVVEGHPLQMTYKADEYLVRNRDIVDACDILFAAPFETEEQLRSGTWSTVRYARKTKKKVFILPRIPPNRELSPVLPHPVG